MMDDYYELLGVDEDAPVDDIRSAYREKKAAVDTSAGDDAKSDVAKLNKAWNVLSDPYQRGRYDQQRTIAREDDGYDDDEDDDEDYVPAPRRTASDRAKERAAQRASARRPLKPTVTLPAGVRFPTTRQRLLAMGIDLLVLIGLFFVGTIFVLPSVEKSQQPQAYDRARALAKTEIPDAKDATSAAKKKASDGVTCNPTKPASGDNQAYCDAKAKEKRLNDEYDKQNKKLLPLQQLVTALVFLVALLFLVLPTLFGRQTLGKEMQRIRVIRTDGAPARFGDVLRRYGILLMGALALSFIIGPTGGLVAVFVATLWTRNPNQQGLHDRLAKTLVVTDNDA